MGGPSCHGSNLAARLPAYSTSTKETENMPSRITKGEHLENQLREIKKARTDLFNLVAERADGMKKRNTVIKPLRQKKESICKLGPGTTDDENYDRLKELKAATIDLAMKEAELESYKTTMDKKITAAGKRLEESIDRDQLKLFTAAELNPKKAPTKTKKLKTKRAPKKRAKAPKKKAKRGK